eukprot:UN07892
MESTTGTLYPAMAVKIPYTPVVAIHYPGILILAKCSAHTYHMQRDKYAFTIYISCYRQCLPSIALIHLQLVTLFMSKLLFS